MQRSWTQHTDSPDASAMPLAESLAHRLLPSVPRWLSPNAITAATFATCWVTAGLAALSAKADQPAKSAALCVAALSMTAVALGDCLDGMQARRTSRTSRLGEYLDHGGDTVTVPLATLALCLAVQTPSWLTAALVVAAAMIYNAQIVASHYEGRFLATATDGGNVQLGVAAGYLLLAVVFSWRDRADPWVERAVLGAGAVAIVRQLQETFHFYGPLRRQGRLNEHLGFASASAAFAALHGLDRIALVPFAAVALAISFRITGGYILASISGRSCNGRDIGLVAASVGAACLVAAALIGLDAPPLWGETVAYGTSGYLLARSAIEIFGCLSELGGEGLRPVGKGG